LYVFPATSAPLRKHGTDVVDDINGRGAARSSAQSAAFLEFRPPHDVLRRRKPVTHMRQVAHVNRRSVGGLHRKVVEFGTSSEDSRSLDLVFQGAEFRGTDGRIRFGALMALTHGRPSKMFRLQRCRIQIHRTRRDVPP